MTDLVICDIFESSFSLEILLATVLLFRKDRVGFNGAAIFLNTVVPWRPKTAIKSHDPDGRKWYYTISSYYHTIILRIDRPSILEKKKSSKACSVYPGSEFFPIPDPGSKDKKIPGPRIRNRIKELSILTQKTVSKPSDHIPDPDLDFYQSRIPESKCYRIPDPDFQH